MFHFFGSIHSAWFGKVVRSIKNEPQPLRQRVPRLRPGARRSDHVPRDWAGEPGGGAGDTGEDRRLRAQHDGHRALRSGGNLLWSWSISASHNGQQVADDAQSVTMEVGKYSGQRLCDVPGGGEDYMLWLWEKGPEFFGLKQLRELSLLLNWVQFQVDDKEVWESHSLPEAIRGKRFLRVFATTGFTVQRNRRMKQVEKGCPGRSHSLPGKQPREINTLGELWAEIEGALLSRPLWANCTVVPGADHILGGPERPRRARGPLPLGLLERVCDYCK